MDDDERYIMETHRINHESDVRESDNFVNLNADKLLNATGKYGKYQMRTYLLLSTVSLLYTSQTFIMGFIGTEPEFSCKIRNNLEKRYNTVDHCHVTNNDDQKFACEDISDAYFLYNETVQYSTLTSEFNLVCKKKFLAELAFSIFIIGGMIVTPIATQISDLYGRRPIFLTLLWTAVVASILSTLAPNYFLFLVFRFVQGIGILGSSSIGWVLGCESVSADFRSIIPIIGNWTWVIGTCFVGAVRIFIHRWRLSYLAISLPGLITIVCYWYVPESPHWLINHGRKNEITRYVREVSRMNGVKISLNDCKSVNIKKKQTARSLVDMIKNKAIMFHLAIQCFILLVMNMIYWGLALTSIRLSDDNFTGYFISAFMDVPAAFLSIPLLTKFGRRTLTFCGLLLQGICMYGAAYFKETRNIAVIFPILARFCNDILWWCYPLLVTEMIPTSIRNLFYGISVFFGETGSVIAPYLELLETFGVRAPLIALSTLSIIAAVLILTTPETKGKPMPEDFDDFDGGWFVNYFMQCS